MRIGAQQTGGLVTQVNPTAEPQPLKACAPRCTPPPFGRGVCFFCRALSEYFPNVLLQHQRNAGAMHASPRPTTAPCANDALSKPHLMSALRSCAKRSRRPTPIVVLMAQQHEAVPSPVDAWNSVASCLGRHPLQKGSGQHVCSLAVHCLHISLAA